MASSSIDVSAASAMILQVGEIIEVRRTNRTWSQGKITHISQQGVDVDIGVKDGKTLNKFVSAETVHGHIRQPGVNYGYARSESGMTQADTEVGRDEDDYRREG